MTQTHKFAARYELKYRLSEDVAVRVARRLEPFVDVDPLGIGLTEIGYLVRSLYYDTPFLGWYEDKRRGLRDRAKLRLRAYGPGPDDLVAFVEVKRKIEDQVHKSRLRLAHEASPRDGYACLDWIQRHCPETEKGLDIFRVARWPGLRPVGLVTYWRQAFVARDHSGCRVTFDRQVSGRPAAGLEPYDGGRRLRPALGREVVLELKFNGVMPPWCQLVIHAFELEKVAVSKYGLTLEAWEPFFGRDRSPSDEGLSAMSTSLLYLGSRRLPPRFVKSVALRSAAIGGL